MWHNDSLKQINVVDVYMIQAPAMQSLINKLHQSFSGASQPNQKARKVAAINVVQDQARRTLFMNIH